MPHPDLPLASLSVDLDNQWSYMKTHGDPGWEIFPSYLDVVVPRILEALDEFRLPATFFIVGKDASLEKNHLALRQITMHHHEIGNHSFSHEPWFHQYSRQEVEREVELSELWIEEVTGVRPRGWRGPGFSFSQTLLEVLSKRGYRYDATTFPTYLGPLARMVYLMNSRLDRADRKKRNHLFGNVADGLRPLRPFQWQLAGNDSLLEIPVTTMPLLRLPMHASYLLYLARHNQAIARTYFNLALDLCRKTRTTPSFLLHPTDFLGKDDVPELGYFPAMDQSSSWKMQQIRTVLGTFARQFDVVTLGAQATRLERGVHYLPHQQLDAHIAA